MSDALLDRRPAARFFCHRCNVEFEDVLQDYICPYCASGFIEQLEGDAPAAPVPGAGSEADMSNLDDSDETQRNSRHPMLNDLAFIMTGGQLRVTGRPESLLEQIVWSIGGGGANNTITAGAPSHFVLFEAPGDYVFGGEDLDAVVIQLLGQLENAGPPPLPSDQIAAIPSEDITPDHTAANTTCSVCWEAFSNGDKVSRLVCTHIFHSQCIEPWLQLHATCPICRRSLLVRNPDAEQQASTTSPSEVGNPLGVLNAALGAAVPSLPGVTIRRLLRRAVTGAQSPASSGSSSTTSSVTTAPEWPPSSNTETTMSTSSTSFSSGNDRDRTSSYNMDIDFD